MTLNFGGLGGSVAMGSGVFRFGDNFVFGSSTADSPVILINPLTTGGNFARTVTVNSDDMGSALIRAKRLCKGDR